MSLKEKFIIFLNYAANVLMISAMMHRFLEAEMQPSTARTRSLRSPHVSVS